MGFAKRHMMEQEEKGDWPSTELQGKKVCTHHFFDSYINKRIKDCGEKGCCSYCGHKGVVRDMYDVGRDIMWKISLYYTDIDNADLQLASGFYDDDNEEITGFKRVGPYVAPEENEFFDSVEELVSELDLCTDNDELDEDINSMFTSEQWISKNIYQEDQTVRLALQWEKFCKDVTSHRRFTFLATPEFEGNDNILAHLHEIVIEQGLCKVLPAGTELYRARKISKPQNKYGFKDITSAPDKYAFPNRMSPVGISMFYASFEKDTPVKECVGGDEPVMILGKFKTSRPLNVIDLTQIPQNSFWMNGWQENRFLHKFNTEITKPLNPNDSNHLQYVPTQVITEYFRYMFVNSKGQHMDGIIYGSSKSDERNIVLFCNQKESENYLDSNVEIEEYDRSLVWQPKKK